MSLSWIAAGPLSSSCDLTLTTVVLPGLADIDAPEISIAARQQFISFDDLIGHIGGIYNYGEGLVRVGSADCLYPSPQLCPRNGLATRHLTSKASKSLQHKVVVALWQEIEANGPE